MHHGRPSGVAELLTHTQVKAPAEAEVTGHRDHPSERQSRLASVYERIATDPRIRSLAYPWLDLFVYAEISTLDSRALLWKVERQVLPASKR